LRSVTADILLSFECTVTPCIPSLVVASMTVKVCENPQVTENSKVNTEIIFFMIVDLK
jgi:hypothetical protein